VTRSKLVFGGIAAVAVMVVGAALAYFLVIKGDSPPPVSIDEALRSLGSPTAASGATVAATPAPSGGGSSSTVSGQWNIVSGASTFVGYRVQEQLAGIGANTAVGRTGGVTGSLTFDGSTITKLEVTANLTQLRSDNNLRDGQLRSQAIETNRFPNATFVLASPISIGDPPAEGVTITRTITGDLTLHGVTKRISMEVQGQLRGGQIVVVGSTEILFADYSISQPRGMSVVSIENKGVMELQLVFAKAAV
jgi:polyisoprenoid-binding protein YceI